MKKTSKIIVMSLLTVALCVSLVAGATFALFTSQSDINIAVSSGKVSVQAQVTGIKAWHIEWADGAYSYVEDTVGGSAIEGFTATFGESFADLGTLEYTAADGLTLTNFLPGDKVEVAIEVTNASTVSTKYQVQLVDAHTEADDPALISALKVTKNGEDMVFGGSRTIASNWSEPIAAGTDIEDITLTIELPEDTDDSFQGKTANIVLSVLATQGNAHTTDPTPVTSEEPADPNLLQIFNALELKDISAQSNAGAGDRFDGKTIKLMNDIDLESEPWTPIGMIQSKDFNGIFDGNGHQISNLVIEDSATDNYMGFFAGVATGTVQNLEIHNAKVTNVVAASWWNSAAVLVGNSYGGHYKDITISGLVQVEAMNYASGLLGYSYGADLQGNITIDVDDGSYVKTAGEDAGGVIAYLGESPSYAGFESATIATNIDVMAGQCAGGFVGTANVNYNKFAHITVTGNVQLLEREEPAEWVKYSIGGIMGSYLVNAGETKVFDDVHFAGSLINPYTDEFRYNGLVGGKYDSGETGNVTISDSTSELKYGTLSVRGEYVGAVKTDTYVSVSDADGLIKFAAIKNAGTIGADPSHGAIYVTLEKDIDLAGKEWIPMEGSCVRLDGKGHTISNVTCKDGWRGGLFDHVASCQVTNLVIENFSASGAQVGVIAGHVEGLSLLSNVTLKGDINITYKDEKSINGETETYASLGAFLGACVEIPEAGKITGLVVDSSCKLTIDISALEQANCGYNSNHSDNLLLGFYGSSQADNVAAAEITVQDGATINIVKPAWFE